MIDVSLSALVSWEFCLPKTRGWSKQWRQYISNYGSKPLLKAVPDTRMMFINGRATARLDIPGNPWFISTLWLAEYYIARAESLHELREAIPYLEWCTKNALPSGVLAEQVHPVNGSPLSVSPLTWSHSSFVWTVQLYTDKFNSFVVNKTSSCNLEDYQTEDITS